MSCCAASSSMTSTFSRRTHNPCEFENTHTHTHIYIFAYQELEEGLGGVDVLQQKCIMLNDDLCAAEHCRHTIRSSGIMYLHKLVDGIIYIYILLLPHSFTILKSSSLYPIKVVFAINNTPSICIS